jgi:protein-disulfide isomerase
MNSMSAWVATMVPVLGLMLLSGPQSSGNGSAGKCSLGSADASVVIEVFSDYQCPACRELYLGTIRPLSRDPVWGRRICVIYRDIPLEKHRYSREASRYAIAARRIGPESWRRVTEALYAAQAKWSQDGKIEAVVEDALPAGEAARLKEFMRLPATDEYLDQEFARANRRQIRSVPTFFIQMNGREERIVGRIPLDLLRAYLSRLLKPAFAPAP